MPHRDSRNYRCGVCGRRGHNRFTCPEIVTVTEDRIEMKLPTSLFERVAARADTMGITVESLIEQALLDESTWTMPLPTEAKRSAPATCACCPDGCRFAYDYRGAQTCGCSPERIALLGE